MSESSADLWDLGRPSVTIIGVPGFICDACGACHFPSDVLRRLRIIVLAAKDRAEEDDIAALSWDFTADGPPTLGSLPQPLRSSMTSLRQLLSVERRLAQASQEAFEACLVLH